MAELPDNKNQEESSSYTPASPVKRIIAWVGVTYMLIFVLLNLYPFFHGGAYLQGLAPLLVCPGAAGLAGPGLAGGHLLQKSLHGPAVGGLCGDPCNRPGAGRARPAGRTGGVSMEARIASGLTALGLTPPAGAAARLAEYGRLLLEQNQVMNLTAITEPDQVADLHFLDSAALLTLGEDLRSKRLIDVGTGAGFPGLPLRILEPSLQLTLLDSLGKRVNWLASVCDTLGLEGVECLHARAEEQALVKGFRDGFDYAVSRAVASLELLCELCLPYLKVGGRFLAMKGVDSGEEINHAARCISILGGRLLPSVDYVIPGANVRHRVVLVEKCTPTPKG